MVPFKMKGRFVLYIAGISLCAFGFIDYSLVLMHVSRLHLFSVSTLPLLYAGAMLIDAFSALFFGYLFDRWKSLALVASTLLSCTYALFIFGISTQWAIVVGVALWGIGMGAQESILKAAVTTLVPKQSRATGYGVFECSFGIFWFLGSWLLGALYDYSLTAMIVVSIVAQLAAIPLYVLSHKRR